MSNPSAIASEGVLGRSRSEITYVWFASASASTPTSAAASATPASVALESWLQPESVPGKTPARSADLMPDGAGRVAVVTGKVASGGRRCGEPNGGAAAAAGPWAPRQP